MKDRRDGGITKKVLQRNIAYLLIVNMPSEQELAEARMRMEARDGQN